MKAIKELERIFAFDFVCKDQNLYYAAYNLSGIFSFDLKTGNNCLLSYIPEEVISVRGGYYSGIAIMKDKLFVVPDHASTFLSYNLKTGHLNKISLPDAESDYPTFSKFQSIICDANKIFCIPIRYPGMVEINEDMNTILHKCHLMEKKNILIKSACIYNRNIYMTISDSKNKETGILLVFRIKTKKYENLDLGYKELYYICSDNEGIWVITDKGLVFWEEGSNKCCLYRLPEEIEKKKQLIKMIYFENNLWMFSNDGTFYTIFRIKEQKFEKITYFSNRKCQTYIINNYISVKTYGSTLFCFNASIGKLLVFKDTEMYEYELKIPKEYKRIFLQNMKLPQEIISEEAETGIWGHFLQLEDYITCIGQCERNTNEKISGVVGGEIFRQLEANKV